MKILGVKNTLSKILVLKLLGFFCFGAGLTLAQASLLEDLSVAIASLMATREAHMESTRIKGNDVQLNGAGCGWHCIVPERLCVGCADTYLRVAPGQPSTIRYPNGGNYRNSERCAWHILPTAGQFFPFYCVKFNSFSMEKGYDGITIYYYDFRGELKSRRITTFGESIPIYAPNLIITFCSDGSIVGEGFEATIVGLTYSDAVAKVIAPHIPTIDRFWRINPSEPFSYPTASNDHTNVEVQVIVQPERGYNLKVSMGSSIARGDSISLYELTCQHNLHPDFQLIARRFKNGSRTDNYPRYSSFPVLAIFRRNQTNSSFNLYFEKL